MATLSMEDRKKWIAKDARFAHVICRCEMVTEGEMVMAIHRPLGATTLDGIKRRTRAGMGRCQAGFCTPKTMDLLARELKRNGKDICKNGEQSYLIVGDNKDRLQEEN